jgi:hypothetical protein
MCGFWSTRHELAQERIQAALDLGGVALSADRFRRQ